jgi:hypothetical protein
LFFTISSGIGLVPAFFVVGFYRRRFKDVEHVV